jgi:hypothetical protein
MGNYLDPLLKSSTAQHFQNYLMLPFYGWSSVICKLCAGVLVAAVAYFTFSKRKDFLTVLPLYLLLVSVGVMGFHVAFPRYLILAIPTLAVVFSFIIKSIPESPKAQLAFSAIFISFIVFSSALMLPYMNTVKPEPQHSEDKWLYLSRIYEEGDAWQWINENTPTDACIATFDIKGYYINRRVLYLDGNQSAPLYKLETIEESIKFLKNRGVDYVLSVPWASPTDKRLPPAYAWCPLTSYLGDPRYLPPVFVGINGTTVYHVCPLESACQGFEEKGMIQPLRHVKVDLTIANNTDPYLGSFYLPIPVDYRGGSLIAQIYTSKPLDVELYSGLIPLSKIEDPLGQYELVKNWTIQSGVNSILQNSSFTWRIDRAGYFTFRFINREKNMLSAFNITFDLNFNSSSFKT